MKRFSLLLLLVLAQAQVFGAQDSSSSSTQPQSPTKQRLNQAKQAFDKVVEVRDQIRSVKLSAFFKDAYLPSKNLLKQVNATLAQRQRSNIACNTVNTAISVLRGFVDAFDRLSIKYDEVQELSRFGGYVFPELLGAANILAQWYTSQNQLDEAFKMHFIAGTQVCRRHMTSIDELRPVAPALYVIVDHINAAFAYARTYKDKAKNLVAIYYCTWLKSARDIKNKSSQEKRDHAYNRFKAEVAEAFDMMFDIVEGEIEQAAQLSVLQKIGECMNSLLHKAAQSFSPDKRKHLKEIYAKKLQEVQKKQTSSSPRVLSVENIKAQFEHDARNSGSMSQKVFSAYYEKVYKPSLSTVQRFNKDQLQTSNQINRNDVNSAATNLVNFINAYAKFVSVHNAHNTQIDIFIELLRTSRELATYYKKKGYLVEECVQHYLAGAKFHKKYLGCRKTLVQNDESLGLMLDHLKLAWDIYGRNKVQVASQLQKSGIDIGAFKNELTKAYHDVLQYLKKKLETTDDLDAFEKALWPLIHKMGSQGLWYTDREKVNALCALLKRRKQQCCSSSSSSSSSTSSSSVSTSSSTAASAASTKGMKSTGQQKRLRTGISYNLFDSRPLSKHTTAHNSRSEMLPRVAASPPLPNAESSSVTTMQDDCKVVNMLSFADMDKERAKAIREQRAQRFAALAANYKKQLAQHAELQKVVITMNNNIKHKEEAASQMAGTLHANRARIKKIEQELIKLKDSVVQSEQVSAQKRQDIEALRLSKKEKEADVTKYEHDLLIDSFRSLGLTIGDSPYDVLAVTKNASMQEVKNAYAALVQKCEDAGIVIGTPMRRIIDQARDFILKSKN